MTGFCHPDGHIRLLSQSVKAAFSPGWTFADCSPRHCFCDPRLRQRRHDVKTGGERVYTVLTQRGADRRARP